MRHFCFYFVLVLLTISCTRKETVLRTMTDVESYVHEVPDSALAVLASLDTVGISSAKVDARYTLLNSIARYRLYIDEDDDAALVRAADYFREHHDDDRLMKALFLAGYIQFNKSDYGKAILSLTEAEIISDELENHFYGGLICRQMALVFERTFNNIECLSSAEKSLKHFEAGGHETHARYALQVLGKVFANNNRYLEGEQILKQVIQLGKEYQDTVLQVRALLDLSENYLIRDDKKPQEAVSCLSFVRDSLHAVFTSYNWADYGLAAALLQKRQLAENCFMNARKAASSDFERYIVDFREYESALALQDSDAALAAAQRSFRYLIDFQIAIERESAIDLQRDFFHEREKTEKLQHSVTRQNLVIAVLLLGLLSIVSFWGVKALMRHKRLLKWENALLSSRIQDMESTHSHALKVSFESGMKLFNTLAGFKWVNQPYKVLPFFEAMLNDLASDERTVKEMMATLNETRNNLMVRLAEQVPSLKKDDLMIYCYLALQLDHTSLCTILNKTPGALNAKIYRIREKIQKEAPLDEREFLDAISN